MMAPLPPPAGGIATWACMNIPELAKRGNSVQVVNEAHLGKNSKQVVNRISIVEELIRTFRIFSALMHYLLTSKPDILHINSSCGRGLIRDYYAARIAKILGCKVVLHCHCCITDQIKSSAKTTKTFQHIIGSVDGIIVLNKASYMLVSNIHHHVYLLPNCINSSEIRPREIIRNKITRIFYCGRVTESKGCLLLLDAARKLRNIEFVMAGLIDKQLEKADVPTNVSLLGQLDHESIIKEYDMAELFVFPSYSEGFSIALLEAMSRGLPCIASDVGANREMLSDGCGVITDENNSEAIIKAIIAMEPYEIRREISNRCIEKVKNEYELNQVTDKLVEIYNDVI